MEGRQVDKPGLPQASSVGSTIRLSGRVASQSNGPERLLGRVSSPRWAVIDLGRLLRRLHRRRDGRERGPDVASLGVGEAARGDRSELGRVPGDASPVSDMPFPILSSAEYRFLRFAIDLLDRLGAESDIDPSYPVSVRTHDRLSPALARMRTALWLFESFPPSEEPSGDSD
jgi:hypothetical protein